MVGGKEFSEDSHHLCSISEYFDVAFQSGMKEAQQKRFEFPDGDPAGWELIMAMSSPFPKVRVNEGNLTMAYFWLDRLLIERGIAECNKFSRVDEAGTFP